jgi:hypothetical protein
MTCLKERYWQPIRLLLHTPVQEHLALAAQEEIAKAYRTARRGAIFFQEFPDTFGPGGKVETTVLSPTIDETFMDGVTTVRLTSSPLAATNRWS